METIKKPVIDFETDFEKKAKEYSGDGDKTEYISVNPTPEVDFDVVASSIKSGIKKTEGQIVKVVIASASQLPLIANRMSDEGVEYIKEFVGPAVNAVNGNVEQAVAEAGANSAQFRANLEKYGLEGMDAIKTPLKVGAAAGAISLLTNGISYINEANQLQQYGNLDDHIGKLVGGYSGAVIGAGVGAAVGSAIPVAGTAAGFVVGAIVGTACSVGGEFIGRSFGDAIDRGAYTENAELYYNNQYFY